MFYLLENKHTIETETEMIAIKKFFKILLGILFEIFSGFSLSVAAFWFLPFSMEQVGVLPSLSGVLSGVFCTVLFGENSFFRLMMVFCVVISMMALFFRMPFDTYFANGLYLGILAGILLSVQIRKLSSEREEKTSFQKEGVWYLFGLVAGILLK